MGSVPHDSSFRAGDVIQGRWEVFASAGGGMGLVYFVRDRGWGNMELAVKSLVLAGVHPAAHDQMRALFRRETQVWLDIGAHPNIVSGFYTLDVEGALRFFMEYVRGQDLDAVHRSSGGRLPVGDTLDYALQLATGMEYVHDKGVVHRDLKPANCLIGEDGVLRVTDFGLGKQRGMAEQELRASRVLLDDQMESQSAGTPHYMAPEQWQSLRGSGAAADVYAFGVMMYQLLSGVYPFDVDAEGRRRLRGRCGTELSAILDSPAIPAIALLRVMHEGADPVPLRELGLQVPRVVDRVVLRCLAKSPDDRPTFAALRSALREAYELATGRPYQRTLAAGLEPTEAGENNRAVSYHVMGKTAHARDILDAWLANHPTALYPCINRAAIDINEGEIEPADAADQVHAVIREAHPLSLDTDDSVRGFASRLAPYFVQHDAAVSALSVAGTRLLVTGAADGVTRVWDRKSGELLRTMKAHAGDITSVALSPANERIVTGSRDGTALVWDLTSDRPVASLRGHRHWVTAVALSADETHVATASADGTASVWRSTDGHKLRQLDGHTGWVEAVVWSETGAELFTAGRDGTARRWNWREGTCVRTYTTDDSPLSAAVLTRGQRCIVVASHDGSVHAFAVRTGEALWSTRVPTRARALASLLDGRRILVACDDGIVRVLEGHSGNPRTPLTAHRGPVLAVASEGDEVWTGGADTTARRVGARGAGGPWPLLIRRPVSAHDMLALAHERQELLQRLGDGDLSAIAPLQNLRGRAVDIQRDPAIVAAIHRAGAAYGVRRALRDAWTAWTAAGTGEPVQAVTSFGDGATWLLAGRAGALHRANHDDGGDAGPVATLAGPIAALVDIGPSGSAAIATRNEVVVLPADAPTEPRPLAPPPGAATNLAASPDGTLLAAAVGDAGAAVWDVGTGDLVGSVSGDEPVTAVSFAHGGRVLVTGNGAGALALWDVMTGTCLASYPQDCGRIEALQVSPTGRDAYVRARRATVRRIDLTTGAALATVPGHTYTLNALAVSRDGSLLATGSRDYEDCAARLWDARTGRLLHEFPSTAPTTAVAFTPDGDRLLTATATGHARSWVLDFDWGLDEFIASEAERLLAHNAEDTYWSGPRGRAVDPPMLLDAWADVLRADSRPNRAPEQGQRAAAIRAAVVNRLRSSLELASADPSDPSAILHAAHAVAGVDATLLVDIEAAHTQSTLPSGTLPLGSASLSGSQTARARRSTWSPSTTGATRRVALTTEATWTAASRPTTSILGPGSRSALIGCRDGKVLAASASGGQPAPRFAGDGHRVTALAWHPRQTWFAVGAADGSLSVIDADTGARKCTVHANAGAITVLLAADDGVRLLVGTWEITLQVWNVDTGTRTTSLAGHTDIITAVARDGPSVVTASADNTARLWHLDGPTAPLTLAGHRGPLLAAAAHSGLAVTGSDDETARVWDLQSGAPVHILRGHDGPVTGVGFVDGGRAIVTADRSGALRVWDVAAGTCIGDANQPGTEQLHADGGDTFATSGRVAQLWSISDEGEQA